MANESPKTALASRSELGTVHLMPIVKYGKRWGDNTRDAEIEIWMIRNPASKGFVTLSHHYGMLRRALWPQLHDERHGQRWHRLIRDTVRRTGAKVTVLAGSGSSGKTHEAAWNYLCEYYCFPEETCVLVSSTDIRGLELRVWGEIKSLHEQATSQYEFIPGNLIDSKHCITTDDVEDGSVRDFRRGVIGIPTIQGGKAIGLKNWVGIKQKRIRLVADEASLMGASFLSAFANLDKNVDFQAIVLGNPIDLFDPLGRASEPKDGWDAHLEPEKTEVWETKFMGGVCVNLVGTDSPNFDFPGPTRFPYLVSKEKIERTLSFFSKDSMEYYSQCKGVFKVGEISRRVITVDMCRKFGAFDKAVWKDGDRIRIAALDAAYSGDRCVLTDVILGKDIDGKQIISVENTVIIPVRIGSPLIPEDQIATYCAEYCKDKGIRPEHLFHDSTGRGTLGTSLARIWSATCNPVEFGGNPTERPVSLDLSIFDEELGIKRLKRCNEHYSKFVTELWYSARYAIESSQIKDVPEETVEEGQMRMWKMVKGNKIEVESKFDMKDRVGRSPDLFDSFVIAIEGARRLGFMISKLAKPEPKRTVMDPLSRAVKGYQKMMDKRRLVSA